MDNEKGSGFGFWQDGNFGGYGAWRTRLAGKGFLRPLVLRLLESKPMNGIEMINAMQEMSHGWWRPSPGSIYPLLGQLVEEGLIKKRSDGKYELTQYYKKKFEGNNSTDEILTSIESGISYLEELAVSNKKEFATYKKSIKEMVGRLSKLV